ncbi:MAG: Smr/MutS family protein [Syntrophales bacterium]
MTNDGAGIMTTSDSSLKHNPFGELKKCVGRKTQPKPSSARVSKSELEPARDPEIEEQVFLEAVQDVKPMQQDKRAANNIRSRPPETVKESPETAIVGQLTNLVKYGEGFVISDTPEYIEGTGYDVHPEFAGRLHRGDFSIQAHVDFHGQSVAEAKKTFEEFLNGAVKLGKRAVLIIHGRGLSSPGEPLLKNNVHEWLTRGHWRKWVIAFSSAQSYDGGAGATYVLLRQRPVSKHARKGRREE